MAEKERFSRNAMRSVALLQLRVLTFLALTALGRQNPSCCHSKRLTASATGGAGLIGPNFHWLRQFKSVPANKKSAIPVGMTDFLELLARFELATSSLPRMRSTG